MAEGVDWTDSATFEEMVFKFFEAHKTDSSEFKALLDYYGKARMKELYLQWIESKKKTHPGEEKK